MATPNRPFSSSGIGQGVGRVLQHGGAFNISSTGPSPKKRVKLEEVPPANEEIAESRKEILEIKLGQMLELKESYYDNLTECFFLQNGGQMMEYYAWRKRPTPQLVHFLKSGRLDSDDEDDNPVIYLKEGKSVEDLKGSSGPGTASSTSATTVLDGSRPAGTPTLSSSSLHRSVSDSRLPSLTSQAKTPTSVTGSGNKKPGISSPNNGTTFKAISTQEAIVERAKQEAQVMSRVAELRKEGLWSSRRLPKVQEPPRPKAHWDYLLEEMQWLAADFLQERKWKKTCARKIAKMVQKYFQDLEQKELKAEKEESMKLKRIASNMAKMVKEFWTNIEKVVQYKQNSRLDEKRKKAMDLHLNFIVNQTEQYSNWLSEGLAQSSKGSSVGSITPDHSVAGDDEFKPDVESESDDEETIEKDEAGIDDSETRDEVAALQKESELPIEQLIDQLPKEILEKPAPLHADDSDEETDSPKKKKIDDDEFEADDDDSDVEETIEEQEKHEEADYKDELDDLKNEGDMDIEELRAKYAAAYDPEFEIPRDSDEESTDINDSDDDDDDDEEDEEEEESEEEEEEEMDTVDNEEDVGLEALVESSKDKKEPEEEGPGKELVNIAEQAASLQPKGYTLQTTEVKTCVPFLLKHTLREYQHVGLDWLATMYEKRLNGILADEMGLGKTIQTIALIAHLACEKGIWGPHLIVVPTSVMLNWEMEFKKWCPAFKILTYYGTQKERKQKRTGWTKTNAFHICITSYKLVIQDHNAFRRKKWKYLILDEAQNIKNFKSQRWQCLLNFNSMRRLLLTGTPLQNSLMELWSLMHFLMPHVFQSHKDFKEWFANPLTGMIEGSHEYNESLIRRLHKVLRPFLLRRLKDDVEKQMPKKYEHVVMCHLSKRQRFLYDEFMAQGKTKETLASGHFMSVINILMQLRKVCNHPSLFDPRPIVSPFQMSGIVYHTASLVLDVCQYDPLNDIDLQRYPGLAEMERDLPAFIAHRVRKLQTPRRLIEEIDVQPGPPPRPQPGKLKANMIRCVSPAIQSGRASPTVNSRSVSPAPVIKSISSLAAGSSQPPLQATVSPHVQGTNIVNSVSQPSTSQPITVQIQQTGTGTRLVVPTSQLSQIPGFLQIVQTSSGSQTVATSSVVSTMSVGSGSPVVTMASSSVNTTVSTSVPAVKMTPGVQSGTTSSVQLPSGVTNHGQKPVMRVSPLADGLQNSSNSDSLVFTAACTTASTTYVMSTACKPVATVSCTPQMIRHLENKKKRNSKSQFFLEPLYDKLECKHKEKLNFISRTNKQHCERKPVYGQDLCDAVNIFKDPYSNKSYRNRDLSLWQGPGHIHCHCAKMCTNSDHPKYLWHRTTALSDILHTPEQYLQELETILDRFVFVTPPVQSTPLRLHVSHPPPSYLREEAYRDSLLRTELSPKTSHYHKICTKMTVQFPELRLIQYDCGKLQTLDILLHRLKTDDHRVLIFTQMTRMLDILEAFLNYHGHRYLRLDGATKIEQRQQLMDRFNADRRIFVFILSTRSGGIGVNLTGADTVIFYDSDWNPTMDAQAQDRCHRIGQTRDVHIYRLVSERTVEENILKKANQKRMLGDMAIEGGNFTTAFFKENTINELFSEPSGLDSLVKEKEAEEKEKQLKMERLEKQKKSEIKKQDPSEIQALAQFEKALAKTEDETDAVAIEQVKAEQKAELAEFDESIPLDENGEPKDEESHVEQELAMLDKELTPIERYAVQFSEQMMEPVNEEELKTAEEDIEAVKRDWELNRLKALKEEEERRAELEEDEMLYTYSRDDAYQQVKKRNKQLAAEARRTATESQSLGLSPRKPGRQSLGAGDELEESPSKKQWVYKTPKIIRDLVKNKNTPVDSVKALKEGRESKIDYDTTEDVDVETVDVMEESVKQKVKKKVEKSEKVKRPRKPKVDNSVNVSVQKEPVQAPVIVSSSPEATKLDSLPGFTVTDRENIFQKLQSPTKLAPDRTNIFEQFNMQQNAQVHGINVVQSPGQIFHAPIGGQAVRLINTPQGQKMVVVSSSQSTFQTATPQTVVNPQNVVLLQGMQGFPQGIVVGNSIVSLQGTPIQVAPVARGGNTINIQGPRVVASPQLVQPARIATRIVSPVTGQSPAFVQRIVGTPQINTLQPASVSVPQISAQGGNTQQIGGLPQFRLPTQLVHNSGGQIVNIQQTQSAVPQKKSVQTIANLIAANKIAKQTPQQQPRQSVPNQSTAMRPPLNVPNLANMMKAQVTHSGSVSSSQVRVNPTVAKLVASHIHSANASSGPSGAGPTAAVLSSSSPVISNITSTGRSHSPTVVKVVSVSRNSSPVPKVTTQAQTFRNGSPVQGVSARSENPVATINIKGLPPGVSIPASLVNSLVSGSIGISKGGLIKGVVPVGTSGTQGTKTIVKKTVVDSTDVQRLAQVAANSPKLPVAGATNGNSNRPSPSVVPVGNTSLDSPVNKSKVGIKVTPVSASSPTLQAWSNPNLVIRTRRAAVQQNQHKTRSPQIGPSPTAPSPDAVIVNSNGPTTVNHVPTPISNHVVEQPMFIATKLEQVTVESNTDAEVNGGVDVIEIS